MDNHRGHRERQLLAITPLLLRGFLCVLCGGIEPAQTQTSDLALPQEKHLRNVKQLTFGGENAEAYFSADGKKLIFQSTRDGRECDQIYMMNIDGSDLKQLTDVRGYDAETTISRKGKLAFTSNRSGDLDIYTMDADGRNVKRLTNELGYDGGPFWSYDGKQIVYRAYHPQTEKEKSD